jgi:hypothetical protein
MFISFSARSKEYKIRSSYCLGSLFAAIFVIIACIYNVVPLLIFGKTRPISWQGRHYTYNKDQNGFSL